MGSRSIKPQSCSESLGQPRGEPQSKSCLSEEATRDRKVQLYYSSELSHWLIVSCLGSVILAWMLWQIPKLLQLEALS